MSQFLLHNDSNQNLLVVMDVFFIKIVIYAATWDTFKPKPEKILKRAPKKNLIKISYTLTKTPFGETGCLSNHYYLVVAQASSFLIHPSFLNEKYILKIVLSRYLKKHIPAHQFFKIVYSKNINFIALFYSYQNYQIYQNYQRNFLNHQ